MGFPIALVTASFVAQQSGWRIASFADGEQATHVHFRPLSTFAERFGAMLDTIVALGFDRIDLWAAHLHYSWATQNHANIARSALNDRGLRVVCITSDTGSTPEDFHRLCSLANIIGAPTIVGIAREQLDRNRSEIVQMLHGYDVRLAIENREESTPQALLSQVGDGWDGRIGVCAHTGWWAAHGLDVPAVLRELAPHTLHVHLKDIRAADSYEPVLLGQGCAQVEQCVAIMLELGLPVTAGMLVESIDRDPRPELAATLATVRQWQAQRNASPAR